jgi:hypothetical protein
MALIVCTSFSFSGFMLDFLMLVLYNNKCGIFI